MGEHAALTAVEWEISREEQDELALRRTSGSPPPTSAGSSTPCVTPYLGLERDENLRADTSLEKLAALKPVFGKGETATMTAGNSTPLTDGASVVLLASEDWAKKRGLPVLGYLTLARDGGRRLRARRRGSADGAGVRDAADAGPGRAHACRTSTSTRSTRHSRRRCWRR